MTLRLGILGGGLQGTEAATLARWAGWQTTLVDKRLGAQASGLVDNFTQVNATTWQELDSAFAGCDLVVPACEDLATLELLTSWSAKSGFPLAFDLEAYRISSDKAKSKELFYAHNIPTPRPYPEAAYPLIAKPTVGSGSRGVRFLYTEADFRQSMANLDLNQWIVEEYCPGASFSLEVTGRPGDYQTWQTTALEMDDIYDCSGVRAPVTWDASNEEELHRISLKLAEALNLRGLMDVEVIAAPQGLRVLEIDARLPSQTPTVVWASTGENLLYRLAENFVDLPAVERAKGVPKGVIYEHLAVGGRKGTWAGEHLLGQGGFLRLHQDLWGAAWVVTDYAPGADSWVATFVTVGEDLNEADEKRRELHARLKKDFHLDF